MAKSFLILCLLVFSSILLAEYGHGAPGLQVVTATPEATGTEVSRLRRGLPVADVWQTFEVEAHGLTISYPPGWLFVEPTAEDPTAFLAGTDLPFLAEALLEILPVSASKVDASLVGLGFQLHPRKSPELAAANNVWVEVVSADGVTLHERLQSVASRLRWVEGFELDGAGVVRGLRPLEEAAGSIRFRDDGGDGLSGMGTSVWIVIVESANAKEHLMLRFEALTEEFSSLEPLLTEIVHRVRWDGQTTVSRSGSFAAEISRTTGMRSGPGEGYPVVNWVTGGQQLALVRLDASGDWWLAAYMPADTTQNRGSAVDMAGQLGWVSATAVTVAAEQNATVKEDSPRSLAMPAVAMVKLSNPFAPPAVGLGEDRPGDDVAWTVFEERGRQLSIFYPEDWIFLEETQPSPTE